MPNLSHIVHTLLIGENAATRVPRFTVGRCTWARHELAAAAVNNPVRRKRIRSLAAVTFTVLRSRVGTGHYTPGHRPNVFDR